MKILFAIDNYFPVVGGTTSVVHQCSNALSQVAEVYVACIKKKNYIFPKDIKYNLLHCKGFYFFTGDGLAFPNLDKDFKKKLDEIKPDIIICIMPSRFMKFFNKYGKQHQIPVVSIIHNKLYDEIKRDVKLSCIAKFMTKNYFNMTFNSDYVWAVSNGTANFVEKFMGEKATKPIGILYNATMPIAENNFSDKEKLDARKYYGIGKDDFAFLSVSRLVKTKNIDLLIDCANIIKEKNKKFKILIVGGGPYEENLKKRVKELGLEQYCIFTGLISNNQLALLYASVNMIVHPCFVETWGLIAMEASYFNTPAIVTEGVTMDDQIIDGKNGLVASQNVESFAERMLYAMNNPDKVKTMGVCAKQTLFRCYTDPEVIKEHMDKYLWVIDDYKKKLSQK